MPHGLIRFLSNAHTIEWVNRQGEQQFGLDRTRDQGTLVTNIVRQPDFRPLSGRTGVTTSR